MPRSRRRKPLQMGEAISIEDVLSMFIVILVLHVVFMVPLVNLDKAKLISARADSYWLRLAGWLLDHPSESEGVQAYKTAFSLQGKQTRMAGDPTGRFMYLEAVSPDSSLMVLRHDLGGNAFIAMHVQGVGGGSAISYRRGALIWSEAEKEWFPASDSIDYGTKPESRKMQEEFRQWTEATRGF